MFNENLKIIRKAKGYTQEELAIKIHVVRQTISKWEKGVSQTKRILRNNLCLPACKLLYLDKREKNFLLTDIISDIIIVRN